MYSVKILLPASSVLRQTFITQKKHLLRLSGRNSSNPPYNKHCDAHGFTPAEMHGTGNALSFQ